VHGGFEHETPNIPLQEICIIDANKLLVNYDNLSLKIKPKENASAEDKPKDGIKKNNQGFYNKERQFKLATQAIIAT
jgi:hypothetical protein